MSIYNAEGVNAIWSALQTSPQNTDGSIGAQDASPVLTRPITGSTPQLLVSQTKLVNAVVMIEQLQNFFNNVAVTQGNYIQTVRDLSTP